MRQKKHHKFRKPPRLQYLTRRFKAEAKLLVLTSRLLLSVMTIGCRVLHFISSALGVASFLLHISRLDVVGWWFKLLSLLCGDIAPKIICVLEAKLLYSVPNRTRFDSDSNAILTPPVHRQCQIEIERIIL